MSGPRHEPEVVRSIVCRAVRELREALQRFGLESEEIREMTRQAERDAELYVQLCREEPRT